MHAQSFAASSTLLSVVYQKVITPKIEKDLWDELFHPGNESDEEIDSEA